VSQQAGRPAAQASSSADGWLTALPELACAGLLVVGTCLAVYAYAGLGATVFTAGGWAIAALALLPAVIPAGGRPLIEQAQREGRHHTSFLGFWRTRRTLQDATSSIAAYDVELRPLLQHLLAARLAERRGLNLYQDPGAARRVLLPDPRDGSLWFWLDPARPPEADQSRSGIPPRALAAIIDRLERL